MANSIYDRLLRDALSDLTALLKVEDPTFGLPEGTKPPPVPNMNPTATYDHARRIYLRYLGIARHLERCYRGMLHPQKREDISKIIDTILIRIVQLRAVIVKWAPYNPEVATARKGQPVIPVPNEYTVWDDLLTELKYSSPYTEIPIPQQYISDKQHSIDQRDKLITGYMNLKLGVERVLVELDHGLMETSPVTRQFSPEDAISIIQRAERGRQGALRAATLKEENARKAEAVAIATKAALQAMEEEAKLAEENGENGNSTEETSAEGESKEGEETITTSTTLRPTSAAIRRFMPVPKKIKHAPTGEDDEDEADILTPQEAIVMIQCLVRQFISKRRVQRERDQELKFLGMKDYQRPGLEKLLSNLGETLQKRTTAQTNNKDKYSQSLPEIHKLVLDEESGEIRDKLRADRLAWLTNQMAQGIIPEEMAQYYAFKLAETADQTAAAVAEAEAKAKADANAKGGKGAATEGPPPDVPPVLIASTPYTKHVIELLTGYQDKWSRIDDKDNVTQKFEESLARNVVRPAATEEIRLQVDASLQDQLINIKAAQADKKKDKKKKEKKPKEKKVKVKPLPGAKMCTGMDTDAMLGELIQYRIINNPRSTATFENFYGDANMFASGYNVKDTPAQRHPVTKHWIPLDPSMAQVRESVMANAVLPLGSVEVRKSFEEFATNARIGPKNRCPRSILLYGPHGVGKTHLAQAVANATGALFMNLSSGNTDGKLTEKGGQAKLLHMAFEIAKDPSFGPVVIYIDEVEKMIPGPPPKGKPKPDPNGPARFKKELPIYINSLTVDHSVMVIGCTAEPDVADPKSLNDCFDRFIYVPLPDYSTRLHIWKQELQDIFAIVPRVLPSPYTKNKKTVNKNDTTTAGTTTATDTSNTGGEASNTGEVSNVVSETGNTNSSTGIRGFNALPLSPSTTYIDDTVAHPLLDHLNSTALATISNGYPIGSIRNAIRLTCTLRRLDVLDVRPLEEMDFVNSLAQCNRIYGETNEMFQNFTAHITGLDTAREVPEAAAAPAKKK